MNTSGLENSMNTADQMQPMLKIDPREGTVSGPGGEVRLEPKVMSVLQVLAEYSGHVVTRTELLDAVWPGMVVTEHTLSRCIYQLREQLRQVGNEPDSANYNPIETLPKRGYRLLAHIERAPSEFHVSGDSLMIELRRRQVLVVGLILFFIVVVGIFILLQ
jgi:DNA-binding winged helix-turn-helix (wHTH) protein